MDLATMIGSATYEFKQKLIADCENMDMASLSPQLAEQITQGIQRALQVAGVTALRTFLAAYEVDETPKDVDGILYRFKQPSEKTFLTPFGQMTLFRNLFQADEGGPSYVMWGMAGEYATLEVRETVLFAAALITPEEAVSSIDYYK